MSSWLNIEIGERIERMRVVETALILAMAAFRLTVVARRVSPDELVPDAEIGSGFSKSISRWRVAREKRLVNSKPLSVWIHSMVKPLCLKKAYAFFKKSAEE